MIKLHVHECAVSIWTVLTLGLNVHGSSKLSVHIDMHVDTLSLYCEYMEVLVFEKVQVDSCSVILEVMLLD